MIKLALFALIASFAFAACPNDEYCASCNDNTCALCVNAYVNDSGVCVQGDGETLENCYTFLSATTCAICNDGYYLTTSLTCAEITIDNCLALDSEDSSKCAVCDNNKVVSNGACVDGADCSIDNCKYCVTSSVCYECDKDYSVNENGACVKNTIDNCHSTIASICVACQRGYYMSSTACESTGVQGSSSILSVIVSMMVMVKLF